MKKLSLSLNKIISILSDGQYHDGTSIGQSLQMTRSAVWKVIQKLQQFGVKIDSIKGKGYALLEPLVLLDAKVIQNGLEKDIEVQVFESLASTNDYLKTIPAPKICLAEQQTQGKGRLNRHWYSPFGKNIYLSISTTIQKDISELGGLSLVIGLAIVKTLNSYMLENRFSVKWPNDVIYAERKISGTLIEIQAESHGASQVIVGIGINVNMLDAENKIGQPWISLREILSKPTDRNEIVIHLINNVNIYLDHFSCHGLSVFKDEWRKADLLTNKKITLQHASGPIGGVVKGINDYGHLLLELPGGLLRAFSSGDTSLKLA